MVLGYLFNLSLTNLSALEQDFLYDNQWCVVDPVLSCGWDNRTHLKDLSSIGRPNWFCPIPWTQSQQRSWSQHSMFFLLLFMLLSFLDIFSQKIMSRAVYLERWEIPEQWRRSRNTGEGRREIRRTQGRPGSMTVYEYGGCCCFCCPTCRQWGWPPSSTLWEIQTWEGGSQPEIQSVQSKYTIN